ncbi:MAG: glycosyltransferase, partial [Actinomycetota bacterium]
MTISVCIPALNEESTIGPIVRTIHTELMDRLPLVDELAVIDSSSSDRTAVEAAAAGATVFQDREVLPDLEPLAGKGEALWKSLFVLRGDVVLWLDADIRNFHPRFVCGPLGPILLDPDVGYVKSFYRRPIDN